MVGEALLQHADVNAGPLVYLAGAVKAADIGGDLRRLGFHVQEPVVYSMTPAVRFSVPIVARFEAGEIDGVILMSAQTAVIYVRLIKAHGLVAQAGEVAHFCLSANVARGLTGLGDVPTVVAAAPNQPSLLAEIARGVMNLP